MWILFAFLSAVFASLMTVFMKMGLKDMNPHLATALRTSLVVVLCWGLVFITKSQSGVKTIQKKEWIYLILASLATFGTWTFYFLALKDGSVKNVMTLDRLSIVFAIIFSAIFLKEAITLKTIAGMVVFFIGAVMLIYYH